MTGAEWFDDLVSAKMVERLCTIERMVIAATGLGLGVMVTMVPLGMIVEASKDVPLGQVWYKHLEEVI